MGQDQSSNLHKHQPHKQKAKLNDIIVVSKVADKDKRNDEDLERLKNIKLAKPILQNALGEMEYMNLPRINSGPISEMILRYQFHLTECAEAVSFDQNVLLKRIKEVDTLTSRAYKNLNERQKYVDNVILQLTKASEVANLLEKIDVNLKNTKLQFQSLNKLLPENEQIHDPELN